MRKICNKKGQMGLDTAKAFILAILGLAIISVATLIVLNALRESDATDTRAMSIVNNTSEALADFFANASTWFTLLSVVVIILIIAVVIVVVNRFGGSGGTSGGL